MGLDMYAWTVPQEWAGNRDTDYQPDADRKTEELFYWRKFNALHGWMHKLYDSKGGTSTVFNCNTVRLTNDDLDDLTQAVSSNSLEPTSGFFFGNTDTIYPEDLESVAEFVAKARAAIAEGKAVFYDSWW